jgi:hydantoinase/carbamoylase family amidase
MQININRLLTDIEKYANYGKEPSGGVTRPSFSESDIKIRQLFIEELQDMGLEVMVDGAANIWGKLIGSGEQAGSIVIGSHLDTVPNGGKYDGALGVLMAKEIVKTLMENNVTLKHNIEIVSFTAEESNDFNLSTFGSKAFVGRLTPAELKDVSDSNGIKLIDALEKVGGKIDGFKEMHQTQKDKKVFIELHIEQGKRLETKNISMALVDTAVGIYRSEVSVIGEANHSGTTMMDHRKDALTAASEMILEVERLCKANLTDLVGTIGKLTVLPNAVNIIPGQIDFILEIRGESEELIQKTVNDIQECWIKIADKRQITIQQKMMLNQKPATLDMDIISILSKTAEEISEPFLKLASMAIHDAVHMAAVTKSAMIFVKSIDGKSHNPDEYSTSEDIEKVGNLMLHGIIKIDQTIDQPDLFT